MGSNLISSFTIGGDLEVERLGYGAMRLTGDGVWGEPKDRPAAIELLRHVVKSGVNFIDTSDAYGPDVNEILIAEALHPYPEDLVIATKGGLARSGPNQWNPDGHPDRLRACCEGSLKRLKLQRIDLYQLHRIDPKVPLADQMGVLKDLQAEGKIRHIGLSEVSLEQLRECEKFVEIATIQNKYNLADRASDRLLDVCGQEGIGFIPWYPLAAGDLAKVEGKLQTAAARVGATPSQVALAWLLERSPVMLPIPGTSSQAHFDENMGALEINLADEDFESLLAA